MLLSLACATPFVACSDDETVKQDLKSPEVSETFGNYNSLDFEWKAVENTIQYGYKLYNPDEKVVEAGVTKGLTASFSDLQPSTDYTLKVWAFSDLNSDYASSPAAILKARTDDLIKLQTPVLTIEESGSNLYAVWTEIEGAEYYPYTITSSDGTVVGNGEATGSSYRIRGLEEGTYTFTLYAATDQGGYVNGDSASADFTIVKRVLYTVSGTYYSGALDESWDATMTAYEDGSYSISAFYGVEDYNLDFSVESNGCLSILNGTPDPNGWGGPYVDVPTGLSSVTSVMIYADYDYGCYFDGSQTSGKLEFGYYPGPDFDGNSWTYDSFEWEAQGAVKSVDDLVGTYDNHCWGIDYIDDANGVEFDEKDYVATITKVDDQTISLDGLIWTDAPITGVVDIKSQTITFKRQDYVDGYEFASYSENYPASEDDLTPVVARINDNGSITFPSFSLFYDYYGDGTYYSYLDAEAELTKQNTEASPAARRHAKSLAQQKAPKAARR